MITFTKEQLIASAHARIEFAEMMLAGELEPLKERTWSIELELARIALASLEAEPVAYTEKCEITNMQATGLYLRGFPDGSHGRDIALYTAPPAQVSVPDIATPQSMRTMFCQLDDSECVIAADVWNACRAAMLDHSEHERGMVEPVSQPYRLPENSFTDDDLEMMAHGDNPQSNAYRELLAFRLNSPVWIGVDWAKGCEPCNSPAIPDCWIPVSERVPEVGQAVLACRPDAPESDDPLIKMAVYTGKSHHGFNCYCTPTHWMPLPTAPQQEGI